MTEPKFCDITNCDFEATHSVLDEFGLVDESRPELYLCTTCHEAFCMGQDRPDRKTKLIEELNLEDDNEANQIENSLG